MRVLFLVLWRYWPMATHVAAFLITIYAYRYARMYEKNTDYTFGTGKVVVLGGCASAVVLAVVAVIGLIINIISALLLKEDHEHSHGHDHNLKAA